MTMHDLVGVGLANWKSLGTDSCICQIGARLAAPNAE
jgi:hypothetical protein